MAGVSEMRICVKFVEPDYVLWVEHEYGGGPAGPRVLRGPSARAVKFRHRKRAAAERDARKLQRHIDDWERGGRKQRKGRR